MSNHDQVVYLQRKGLLDQRSHLTRNTHKEFLLEVYRYDDKPGWYRQGSYKSFGQAFRTYESLIQHPKSWKYISANSSFRINGQILMKADAA